MKEIKAKELTLEDYHQYGEFTNLLDPKGESIDDETTRFYRDLISVYTGNQVTGISIVNVDKREMVPDKAEQHEKGTEILLPLDDDVVIFVAPASNKCFPYGKEEAFIIPKGTLVTIKPGVWHKAPFCLNKEKSSTLIILPEREYAIDCVVIDIEENKKFKIIL